MCAVNSFILFKMTDMRTAYLIFFMLLLIKMAVAQNLDTIPVKQLSRQQKPKTILWYINAPNLSYGNFFLMPGLGFTIMDKRHWGIAFEVKSGAASASNTPSDFEPGGFLLFGDDGLPDEQNTLFLLSAVREFRGKSSKMIPTIQAGLSYSERVYPDNFVYLPPSNGWFDFSSNYNYVYKKSKRVGLYIKPGCKYLLTKKIAATTALWTVLQPKYSYYGVEVGLQFGRLR